MEAAESGDPDAMLELGGMYMAGIGTELDRDKALVWYLKAVDAGYLLAYRNVAGWYLYDEDEEGLGYLPPTEDTERIRKAHEWLEKGAALGDPDCMNELGIMYILGEIVQQDEAAAFALFEKAYNADGEPAAYAQAAHNLAKCYHYGTGVEPDLQKARIFAEESCALEAACEDDTGSLYFLEMAEEELEAILEELED